MTFKENKKEMLQELSFVKDKINETIDLIEKCENDTDLLMALVSSPYFSYKPKFRNY